MKRTYLKKNDVVFVCAGDDRGKTGKILRVFNKKAKVIIEKVNIVKRHKKADRSQTGGIIEKEAPISMSNVMLYCGKCTKPVRPRNQVSSSGKTTRACSKCGEVLGAVAG